MRRGSTDFRAWNSWPGAKLYAARGDVAGAIVHFPVGGGEIIEFIPMQKELAAP